MELDLPLPPDRTQTSRRDLKPLMLNTIISETGALVTCINFLSILAQHLKFDNATWPTVKARLCYTTTCARYIANSDDGRTEYL
jgi:hypothetical protein